MQAVGNILPIAVAVALSSVPILATILILLSPHRGRSAVPFLIGWVIGLVAVVFGSTALAQLVPDGILPRRQDEAVGMLEILLGAALIIVAAVSWWVSRRRPPMEMPKWLRSIGNLGPWSSFGVALVLNIRPKALLLALAAGLTVQADAESSTEALIAIAIYVLIAASTVGVPIIATLANPTKMEPRLVGMKDWLTRNGTGVTAIILVVIGVDIIGTGIARL